MALLVISVTSYVVLCTTCRRGMKIGDAALKNVVCRLTTQRLIAACLFVAAKVEEVSTTCNANAALGRQHVVCALDMYHSTHKRYFLMCRHQCGPTTSSMLYSIFWTQATDLS